MRLLVSAVGGDGHLQPLLPLARAATAAGHDVTITAARSLAPSTEGFRFASSRPDVEPQHVPLRPVDLDRERAVVRDSFAGWMAEQRAHDLLALCAESRPDAILRDQMDYGAAIVAERLGIPHASVLVIAAGGFDSPSLVAEPLDRLRAAHGLAPDPGAAALTRDLVLSPFPPSLRDPAHPLPETATSFRPYDTGATSGGRIVYVTLGTIFNTECGDLFSRILRGVRDLPVDVVVTTGRAVDPEALGPQPPNVRVERYIPQATLLPACAAVVTHGGSGSVSGALAHGVPVVCLPLGADQPFNAARCADLGAGLTLDPVTLTPDDVRGAVTTVLTEPAYRTAAGFLRDEYAALPPVSHALGLLERLVG